MGNFLNGLQFVKDPFWKPLLAMIPQQPHILIKLRHYQ
jgi:hypothetical protein